MGIRISNKHRNRISQLTRIEMDEFYPGVKNVSQIILA